MKKYFTAVFFCFIFQLSLSGQNIPSHFEPGNFDISYTGDIQNLNKQFGAFKFLKGIIREGSGYQIYYSLIQPSPDLESVTASLPVFAAAVSTEMAGSPDAVLYCRSVDYSERELKKLFGADSGIVCRIVKPESSFLKGSAEALLFFFVNNDKGIVCQILALGNSSLLQNKVVQEDLKSFHFDYDPESAKENIPKSPDTGIETDEPIQVPEEQDG